MIVPRAAGGKGDHGGGITVHAGLTD